MLRTVFLSAICLAFLGNVFCQSGELSYRGSIWKDENKLKSSEVRELMSSDSEAFKLFNTGKGMEIVGYIIGCPSACLFGYDLGTRLAGAKGNYTVLIASVFGTVIGLLIGVMGENKIKQSVQLYNANLNSTSYRIDFGLAPSGGVGLTVRF